MAPATPGAKLLRAAEAGDAKAVEALLKAGAPVFAADEARPTHFGDLLRRLRLPAPRARPACDHAPAA